MDNFDKLLLTLSGIAHIIGIKTQKTQKTKKIKYFASLCQIHAMGE